MAIDWNMARMPNALAMMMKGYDEGVEMRKQERSRTALNAMIGPQAGDLTSDDARTAMQFRKMQTDQAAAEREQAQAQMQQTGRLLRMVKADPSKYGQARAAAIQMGIPAASIPEAPDPAWIDRQIMIADAYEKDGGQELSGIARELVNAGYKPGTSEFQSAMTSVINNKYASDYVDEKGNTRRRSALNLSPARGGPVPGTVEEGYRFKGGNPADPNAWEPVGQGGPQVAPAGSFRP